MTFIPIIEILETGLESTERSKPFIRPDCDEHPACYIDPKRTYNSAHMELALSPGTLFRVWIVAL
jgi:hypothetical protein